MMRNNKKLIATIIIGTILIFGSFLANLTQAKTYELNDTLMASQKNWMENNPDSFPINRISEKKYCLYKINKNFHRPGAPPVPIRQPAEFEPMEGVLIRYPFGISYQIIAEMSEDAEVVTIVASISQKNYVKDQYDNHGVNMDHCSFLIAPTDTYWTRDYGPWFIFNGDDQQGIVDFEYNRPRPNDDQIPVEYGNWQDIPVYYMDIVHSGGNYMTDGHGIAVSTDLVWSENPGYTHEETADMVENYLGITTYHVVEDALGGYIEHIDCWAKYLAPDVIMIIEVSPGHSHYDDIEDAVSYFENQISCYGTPYEVVRIYTHMDEPYINSLILNDKVFVPITNSEWDDEAIEAYEDAMPGYEVLGFTGSWMATDALHCRTMGITDRHMLYIEHTPLTGDINGHNGYKIDAKIFPYSREDIISSSTGVYWKTEDQISWSFTQMTSTGDDKYQAVIPQPLENNTKVYYYVYAEDYSDRSENHPYIGADDAHSFKAILLNDGPEKPDTPQGETNGKTGKKYSYTISTADPDDDQVYYMWDWGDGTFSDWLGPFNSGDLAETEHVWNEQGTYNVKVKSKDIFNEESNWSEPLSVTMPSETYKPANNVKPQRFYFQIIEQLPQV